MLAQIINPQLGLSASHYIKYSWRFGTLTHSMSHTLMTAWKSWKQGVKHYYISNTCNWRYMSMVVMLSYCNKDFAINDLHMQGFTIWPKPCIVLKHIDQKLSATWCHFCHSTEYSYILYEYILIKSIPGYLDDYEEWRNILIYVYAAKLWYPA